MQIISDDIGSFPLPSGIVKEEMEEIALGLTAEDASEQDKMGFNEVVSGAMELKIESGIERPNYPQFRDMIAGFFTLIERFYEPEEPWVIKNEFAKIPEIDALQDIGKRYYEKKAER